MAINRGAKRRVAIVLSTRFKGIGYAFDTNVKDTTSTALGHKTAILGSAPGLIFGCNNVRPAKGSKKAPTGNESSFCGSDKIDSARKAGWKITKGKITIPRNTAFTKAVYVTIEGVNYCWHLPNPPAGVNIADLGVKEASTGAKDLFLGCQFPKPPRASKELADGSLFSTFYDPSITPPTGWLTSGALEEDL